MPDASLLSLALAAGMIAAFNPCGFALLPAYLTLVVAEGGEPGGAGGGGRGAAVGRALGMSASMTLGFVAVFGAFGLAVVPLALSIERFLPWATVVIGIALVGLGAWLVSGREILLSTPRLAGAAPGRSLWSTFVYGIAYAVASLSCTVGPFLAVTTSTVTSAGWVQGLAVFVAYALGMGLVVGTLAVAVALARETAVSRARRLLPHVSRVSGVLLVLAGLYVAYYGWYELRVFAGGSTADPVVDAALQIQGVLARWVGGLSAWTVAVAFAVLVGVGFAAGAVARRRRRRAQAPSVFGR